MLEMLLNSLANAAQHQNHPPTTDEDRAKALLMTSDQLKKLNAIRTELGLPPDCMMLMLQTYNSNIMHAGRLALEKQYTLNVVRAPLPIYSRVGNLSRTSTPMTQNEERERHPIESNRCPPGRIVEVIERVQHAVFRAEEIEIHGDPSHWLVHDISIGNRSQLQRALSPLKGEGFRKGGIMSEIRLDTCQTAMDFAMLVEYVGPLHEGAVFEATAVGSAANR